MKGKIFSSEISRFQDEVTGVEIRRLTNYRGHSNHLYFTNNGWYDENRKLVFESDRDNCFNLFSVDLESGEITQLTDLTQDVDTISGLQQTHVNPKSGKAYLKHEGVLYELDLSSLEQRELYRSPQGRNITSFGYTADGKALMVGEMEDTGIQVKEGYLGFRETFERHPRCHLRLVDIQTGSVKELFSENNWIGHVNTSPTMANIATFCHEGPWYLVDNRIWAIDLTDGRVWPLRKRQGEEMVGHEYWFDDGKHVAYECHQTIDGASHRHFGVVRYDGTVVLEVDFSREAAKYVGVNSISHVHSNNLSYVVGDGNRDGNILRIWKWDGKGFDGPRALCTHRCSFHIQRTHGHPRFSPDSKSVLFTNDENGYGNLYQVFLPEDVSSLMATDEFALRNP